MPTYDYRCEACGHETHLFQSITEAPKRECPKCGKRRLKRLLGAGAGIIFKGSGFYETDYKRGRSGSGEGEKKSEPKAKPERPSDGEK
jgi:putative FmdB family regulatory protein